MGLRFFLLMVCLVEFLPFFVALSCILSSLSVCQFTSVAKTFFLDNLDI